MAWGRFTDNPTITTLESQHYDVMDIPFPAVAVCNNNKISRSAADQYAQYLYVIINNESINIILNLVFH